MSLVKGATLSKPGIAVFICSLPAFLAAACLVLAAAGVLPDITRAGTLVAVLVALAFVGLGVLAMLSAQAIVGERRKSAAFFMETAQEEKLRRRALETEVELLKAIRDMSKIVNDQGSLEEMFNSVGKVLKEFMGAEELAIFSVSMD